jgi:hypothetical protein
MLPLSPPARPVDPGYPTRDHVLDDRTLRRQVLSVLAAAILTGCTGEPVPTGPAGRPPSTTAPQPSRGAPASPEPGKLMGDVISPEPIRPKQIEPEPQRLGGAPVPAQPAKP